MKRSKVVEFIIAEVKACGLDYAIEHGGKHPRLRLYVNGRRYTYTMPKTASDHRALLNCRAGVRRLIDQAVAESDLPKAAASGK